MPKKLRIRPRFYIFTIVGLALIVVAAVLLLQGPSECFAQQGSMTYEKKVNAVIMRNEQVESAENYGMTEFAAEEGAAVESGQKIADVYKWGFNDSILKDLMDVQQKIKDYQENTILRDILDKDLNDINSQISETENSITAVINAREAADLLGLQEKLQGLMAQRKDYLKKTVKEDEQLGALYAQEQELTSRINSWRIEQTAPDPGVVSFYLDGYEEVLRPENINKITFDDISNIIGGLGKAKAKETATTKPLYRLADGSKWYCLIAATGNELQGLKEGVEVNINFEGFPEKPFKGKPSKIRDIDKNHKVYVLEIDDAIGPLMDVRRVTANLRIDFTGTKLPASAVKKQESKSGIYLLDGAQKRFIPVDVLASDGKECIVMPAYSGDTIQTNQRVSLR